MVERTLTATVAAHPDCSVAVWGPRRLRDMRGFQATAQWLDDEAEPVDKSAALALEALASQFAADIAQEKERGVKTLILSEENFVGSMGNNFRQRKFYPDVAQRLAAFDSLFPMSPKRIALGVREYGSVWTSAFQYLPQSGKKAPNLDHARKTLLNNRRGWPEVADAVKHVWPDTPLMMWQQEHLATESAQICAAIAGLDPDQIVVPDGKINARKKQTPRPAVFDDAERKSLKHRYNRHLRRMKEGGVAHWAGVPQ